MRSNDNNEWQEAAFSNRHTHNRNSKSGSKGFKSNFHGFNVQKTFGSYEMKSPKFPSISGEEGEKKAARLEIYTLNEAGNALVGELFIPGCLIGNVLMAGSRKVMTSVIRELVSKNYNDEDDEDDKGGEELEEEKVDSGEPKPIDQDEDKRLNSKDRKSRQKALEFEKNTFRSPKFWMKWQGRLLSTSSSCTEVVGEILMDGGYIVFNGNACEKFDGTLSCAELGWKNVKVSGWKKKGTRARDLAMRWIGEERKGDGEEDDGDEEEEEGQAEGG